MVSKSWSRRDVLKLAATTGGAMVGALALPKRFGQAKLFQMPNASRRRFVFVYIPGGWDLLLTLDPREFELAAGDESAYRREVERTQIDTQYQYGFGRVDQYAAGTFFAPRLYRPAGTADPFSFGPGVVGTHQDGTPVDEPNLVNLVEDGVPMAILRGLNMGTLGHEPGTMYALTGEPAVGSDARGTSMSIRVASGLGEMGDESEVVVPTMAMGVQSFTGSHPGRYGAFMLGSIDDVERMLRRPDGLHERERVEMALEAFSALRARRFDGRSDPNGLARQIADSQARTAVLLESDLAESFRFLHSGTPEAERMRGLYGVNAASDPLSPGVIAGFAAQAIKHGLSQFVSIGFVQNNVDTHGSSNPGHLDGLYPSLRAISALVKDLAETPAEDPLTGTWLDHTTIVVFSEFGRTPLHNVHGGRDHHFLNATLLIGAGVRPGAVVGGSTEVGGMQPRYFDLENQSLLPEGAEPSTTSQRFLLPEDVGATLLASVGLDYGEYRIGVPLWNAITQTPY